MRRLTKQLRRDAWRAEKLAGRRSLDSLDQLCHRAVRSDEPVGTCVRVAQNRTDVFLNRERENAALRAFRMESANQVDDIVEGDIDDDYVRLQIVHCALCFERGADGPV